MLNEHYGSSYNHQYDSNNIMEHQLMNNISSANYEWQTLLSYDHWPTLFSFYNISYDNRYLTIMPSIYLPILFPEDQELNMTKNDSYQVKTLFFSLKEIILKSNEDKNTFVVEFYA